MAHPWFARIDWHTHAHSAGQPRTVATPSATHSLQALAAAGGTLAVHGVGGTVLPKLASGNNSGLPPSSSFAGVTPLRERTGSGGSKTSLGGAEGDTTRSVHSMGMESERSAASTNFADLANEGNEATAHLDNLIGLNERGLAREGESLEPLLTS